MIINQASIIDVLSEIANCDDLKQIKSDLTALRHSIKSLNTDELGLINIGINGDTIKVNPDYLFSEINQIIETKSIERTKYYLQRLIKGLTETKTSKINDLNLNRWKEYNDIITDSLWILDRRDNTGVHNAGYWGNFIPQIPNQLLKRYTKTGDWILDPFLGSGTTLIECQRLGRNGIGIELQSDVADLAKRNIESEKGLFSNDVIVEVLVADSTNISYTEELTKLGVKQVQFVIAHPPYWDIIKFSNSKDDLSNADTLQDFLQKIGSLVDGFYDVLENDRYCALVIGDKYSQGEWIPLGFYCMQEFLNRGFLLKATIVKNFEETKGKMNQKELWRYRALVGGFYIFKHEYIFLFKKRK